MSGRDAPQSRADRAPQRISAVLPTILSETKQQHGTLRTIQQRWRDLVGKGLAAHTRPVSFRRGRLVIHADRSGDSFTLNYQRQQLLTRLRENASIEELIIRVGETARAATPLRHGEQAQAARKSPCPT